MNLFPAVIMLAALLMSALPGQAATPGDAPRAAPPTGFGAARGNAGKSFVDPVAATFVEEPFDFPPATFQAAAAGRTAFAGPLPSARREPEPYALVLASLGLLAYIGRRRKKALAATF
jgi:hypothetical protein